MVKMLETLKTDQHFKIDLPMFFNSPRTAAFTSGLVSLFEASARTQSWGEEAE